MRLSKRVPWVLALLCASLILGAGMAVADDQAEVGKPAPPFTLNDLEGNEVSLSDFEGKVVVLTFWGWSCVSCKEEEMPALQHEVWENEEEFPHEKIQVLSINMDVNPDLERIKGYTEDKGLTYPMLVDGLKVAAQYLVFATPILMYIDHEGVLQHKKGPQLMDESDVELLKELVDAVPDAE